jgi:hypothetical protein
MWTTISAVSAIVIAIFGLFWHFFAVATNSHMRAEAQKLPNSWLHLGIHLFDRVMEYTLLRPIDPDEHQTTPEVQPTGVSPSNAQQTRVSQRDFLTARYGIQIEIDPTVRVPKRIWSLWQLPTVFIVFLSFPVLLYIVVAVPLSAFIPVSSLFLGGEILLLSSIFLIIILTILERGPLGVVFNLWANPCLMADINSQTMFIHSSWMPKTIFRTVDNIQFIAAEDKFLSEIFVKSGNGEPRILYSWPTYFRKFLLPEGELSQLANKLNAIVAIAQHFPAVDIDDPIFVPVPPSHAAAE